MAVRRSGRGFTFVEMLVSIGIIALVTAILLPAMNVAREQAQRTTCLSNLRQLTMAWQLYAQEHNGRLVSSDTFDRTCWVNGSSCCSSLQTGALWPYVKNTNIYMCPEDQWNDPRSYAINGYLNGEYGDQAAKTLSEIRQPTSGVFCFIEEFDPRGMLQNSFVVSQYPDTLWIDLPAPWHKDAVMVSWCDGHAAAWRWADSRSSQLRTRGVSQPNNPDLRQLQAWLGIGPTPPGVIQ